MVIRSDREIDVRNAVLVKENERSLQTSSSTKNIEYGRSTVLLTVDQVLDSE